VGRPLAAPAAPAAPAGPAGLTPADFGIGRLFWELRDAAVVGDAGTGRIVLWNPAAERLFGYTAAEAVGLPIDVLVPHSLKRRHRAGLTRFRETGHGPLIGGGAPVELPARRKGGEEFWVELSLSPLEVSEVGDGSGAGRFVLALVRDATPRKRAEAEHLARLRAETGRAEAERRARLAAFGAEVGGALNESPTLAEALQRTAEALVRHLDAAFARIWTLDEAAQMLELRASAGLYTHLDGGHARVPVGRLKIGRIAREGRPHLTNDVPHDPQVGDRAWARREGLVAFAGYPLLVERRVVGVLALFARHPLEPETLDELAGVADAVAQCVERKRTEAALQRSEARFRALIERSADMLTLHRRDGTITYLSPSTSRLLGYAPADLLGHSLLESVHPEDRPRIAALLADLVARPGAVEVARYRLRHRDGTWRWIEATGTNLLEEPAVGAVVINRRDVTAEVEAQQLLEARVAERTRELATLLEVGRELAATPALRPLLEALLAHLKALVDYAGVAVLLREGEALRYAFLGGPDRWEEAQRVSYRVADLGDVWERLGGDEPVVVGDVRDGSPDARRFRALTAGETGLDFIRSLLWVPLVAKGRLIGLLSIARAAPHAFAARDAALALAVARQAAVAIESARLHERDREAAALEERQRLARELHDSVSQALYSIALNAAAAGESLRRQDTPRTARQVREVRRLAGAGLAEMRALIFELRAESLAEEGLVAALQKQAAAVEARHALKVRAALGPEPPLPLAAKEALYRIAQEALHNTVKHARARAAELTLSLDGGRVALLVRDRGRGFDAGASFPGHLGLRSMRERAAAAGGTLEVESAPRRGTTVRVSLPLAPAGSQTSEPGGGSRPGPPPAPSPPPPLASSGEDG
jgi:PAS domain S-box-containing protein